MASSSDIVEVERQQQLIMATSSSEFHKAMKASLLLKDDMPDFLSSAPLVVSLLGHLRLLGWSAAATVNIERQQNSLFKSNRMSPNLVQLQQQGRKMFEIAENKMMSIEQTIQGLFSPSGTVAAIVDSMRQAQAGQMLALQSVDEYMESLRTGIMECSTEAKAVEKEIDLLRGMAEELDMACADQFATIERKYKEDEVEQDLLQRDEANVNETMARLDGVLQEAKKNYEAAQSDVKHAREKAGGLSTFGLVALASVANPIIKTVANATDLVKGFPDLIGKFASPTFGIRTIPERDSRPEVTETASKAFNQQAASPHKSAADNMAFEKAWDLSMLVRKVQALLDNDGQESEISDYIDEIKQLRNEIQPRSKWSRAACTILNDCEEVLKEMLKSHKSSHDLNKTTAKAQHVKGWGERLAKAGNSATELETKADSQPGVGFGMSTPIFDAKATRLIQSDGSIDSNAFLLKRQEDLARMEMLCSAALDNYQKKADQRSNIQGQVILITRKLTRLQAEQVTTDDIRKVLKSAAQIMGRLQTQVRSLLQYFKRISAILQQLQDFGCKRFAETVQKGISRVENGQDLAFSQFEAQGRNSLEINLLRGHAGALVSNCSFYLEVSGKHLRPISNAVSELPLTASSDQQQVAIQKLEGDVKAAAEAISASGRQRILDMKKTLEEMGKVSHSNRQGLPELSISKMNAIAATVETISQEQGQQIEATDGLEAAVEDFGGDL